MSRSKEASPEYEIDFSASKFAGMGTELNPIILPRETYIGTASWPSKGEMSKPRRAPGEKGEVVAREEKDVNKNS